LSRSRAYGLMAATLTAGLTGGYLFYLADIPLAWMLGAMTICTIAALGRVPVRGPEPLWAATASILGVMLGSGFTPDIVNQAARWPITMAGLVVFVGLAGTISVLFLRHVGKFDMTTAYFAGMPGGISEMMLVGKENGGDMRKIALCHSARIFLVVFAIPFVITIGGHEMSADIVSQGLPSIADTSLMDWAWLGACALAGAMVGRLLRLPAKYFLGPMLVSAIVHAGGFSAFNPPAEIVILAQVVLGTIVGCRFAGAAPREIMHILALSLGSTGIVLLVTMGMAAIIGSFSGQGFLPVLLAYSPGGLMEMSLVALALNVEITFVAVHHLVRVIFVMFTAPLLFAWVRRRRG
jgi:uncharacterized protein